MAPKVKSPVEVRKAEIRDLYEKYAPVLSDGNTAPARKKVREQAIAENVDEGEDVEVEELDEEDEDKKKKKGIRKIPKRDENPVESSLFRLLVEQVDAATDIKECNKLKDKFAAKYFTHCAPFIVKFYEVVTKRLEDQEKRAKKTGERFSATMHKLQESEIASVMKSFALFVQQAGEGWPAFLKDDSNCMQWILLSGGRVCHFLKPSEDTHGILCARKESKKQVQKKSKKGEKLDETDDEEKMLYVRGTNKLRAVDCTRSPGLLYYKNLIGPNLELESRNEKLEDFKTKLVVLFNDVCRQKIVHVRHLICTKFMAFWNLLDFLTIDEALFVVQRMEIFIQHASICQEMLEIGQTASFFFPDLLRNKVTYEKTISGEEFMKDFQYMNVVHIAYPRALVDFCNFSEQELMVVKKRFSAYDPLQSLLAIYTLPPEVVRSLFAHVRATLTLEEDSQDIEKYRTFIAELDIMFESTLQVQKQMKSNRLTSSLALSQHLKSMSNEARKVFYWAVNKQAGSDSQSFFKATVGHVSKFAKQLADNEKKFGVMKRMSCTRSTDSLTPLFYTDPQRFSSRDFDHCFEKLGEFGKQMFANSQNSDLAAKKELLLKKRMEQMVEEFNTQVHVAEEKFNPPAE